MAARRKDMLIASPNLSMDRTVGIESFDPGHVHRVHQVEVRVGGGGANAARVARLLGATATLTTMVPDQGGEKLLGVLRNQGVLVDGVRRSGRLRIATILRETDGRWSVLNELGTAVDGREWEAFTRRVRDDLADRDALLCSGSLPPGAPADSYARLASAARHSGSACVVDAAGEVLAATVESGESLVVPNLAEAEELLGRARGQAVVDDADSCDRAQWAANRLLRRGAPRAVVTAGRSGAAFAEQGPHGRRGWIAAPPVDGASPIGAGDAFACGLTLRLGAGDRLENATRFAVAVAAAHLESPPGALRRERVEALGARIAAPA